MASTAVAPALAQAVAPFVGGELPVRLRAQAYVAGELEVPGDLDTALTHAFAVARERGLDGARACAAGCTPRCVTATRSATTTTSRTSSTPRSWTRRWPTPAPTTRPTT
jgi:hypothetical protein